MTRFNMQDWNTIINWQIRKKAYEATNIHLNPINVLAKIDKILPDNSILIADGGDFVATAGNIIHYFK